MSDNPREMIRCECAGVLFQDAARVAEREGIDTFDVLLRRSGCGQICTSCRPDLGRFLARRGSGTLGPRPLMAV